MSLDSAGKLKVSPPELLSELLQFNFFPTQDMDSSWWQSDWLPGELSVNQQLSNRAQFHLSQFFLRQFELSDNFDFDFEIKEKRVALLESKKLTRLIYLVGLTLQSRRIAHVIRSQDQQVIKNAISPADYLFAIKRGIFLLDEVQFKQPIPGADITGFDSLDRDCYRLGVKNIATTVRDMPPAFTRRLQFKLSKTMIDSDWEVLDQDGGAHARLLLSLMKEMDPTWHGLQ